MWKECFISKHSSCHAQKLTLMILFLFLLFKNIKNIIFDDSNLNFIQFLGAHCVQISDIKAQLAFHSGFAYLLKLQIPALFLFCITFTERSHWLVLCGRHHYETLLVGVGSGSRKFRAAPQRTAGIEEAGADFPRGDFVWTLHRPLRAQKPQEPAEKQLCSLLTSEQRAPDLISPGWIDPSPHLIITVSCPRVFELNDVISSVCSCAFVIVCSLWTQQVTWQHQKQEMINIQYNLQILWLWFRSRV